MKLNEVLDQHEGIKEKIDKLMMRGVQERYALFYCMGVSHTVIMQMNLTGSPFDCQCAIINKVNQLIEMGQHNAVDSLINAIVNSDVPEELN